MTEHDNLADYTAPIIYDQENGSFEPDGPFFLEMACQADGPVLDLGYPLFSASRGVYGRDVCVCDTEYCDLL